MKLIQNTIDFYGGFRWEITTQSTCSSFTEVMNSHYVLNIRYIIDLNCLNKYIRIPAVGHKSSIYNL